jgi:hypothetical protein
MKFRKSPETRLIREAERTPDLDPRDLELIKREFLYIASILAEPKPNDRPQLFWGFFSVAGIDPPNVAYGRDMHDNDLSPQDTIRIRDAIYNWLGATPPYIEDFKWVESHSEVEHGIAVTGTRFDNVYIEELVLRRTPEFWPRVSAKKPDYQSFLISLINTDVNIFFEEL